MTQTIAVQIILGMAVLYLALGQVRAQLRRRRQQTGGGCASGCGGCALAKLQRGPCHDAPARVAARSGKGR